MFDDVRFRLRAFAIRSLACLPSYQQGVSTPPYLPSSSRSQTSHFAWYRLAMASPLTSWMVSLVALATHLPTIQLSQHRYPAYWNSEASSTSNANLAVSFPYFSWLIICVCRPSAWSPCVLQHGSLSINYCSKGSSFCLASRSEYLGRWIDYHGPLSTQSNHLYAQTCHNISSQCRWCSSY